MIQNYLLGINERKGGRYCIELGYLTFCFYIHFKYDRMKKSNFSHYKKGVS